MLCSDLGCRKQHFPQWIALIPEKCTVYSIAELILGCAFNIQANTVQKNKFTIKDFLSKCDQKHQKTENLVIFTEEILNGKFHCLRSEIDIASFNLTFFKKVVTYCFIKITIACYFSRRQIYLKTYYLQIMFCA